MKYLCGIQPTGKLTIGNYLGCLSKALRLQEEGEEVTFLIANYHSLTTDNYSELTEQELIKLGCKNIQHQTPEYTELFFKLCCKLNLGTLEVMPQYKDKKDQVKFNLGLLLYPVLMAADIIINDPDIVIIGQDQTAHLDLVNDIAKRLTIKKRFNYQFGDIDKIYSLINPTIKMSKSSGDKHVLYLFEEDFESKLKIANTNEKGLANLKQIGDFFRVKFIEGNNLQYKINLANKLKEVFNK